MKLGEGCRKRGKGTEVVECVCSVFYKLPPNCMCWVLLSGYVCFELWSSVWHLTAELQLRRSLLPTAASLFVPFATRQAQQWTQWILKRVNWACKISQEMSKAPQDAIYTGYFGHSIFLGKSPARAAPVRSGESGQSRITSTLKCTRAPSHGISCGYHYCATLHAI
jgi:hypothetical protein